MPTLSSPGSLNEGLPHCPLEVTFGSITACVFPPHTHMGSVLTHVDPMEQGRVKLGCGSGPSVLRWATVSSERIDAGHSDHPHPFWCASGEQVRGKPTGGPPALPSPPEWNKQED